MEKNHYYKIDKDGRWKNDVSENNDNYFGSSLKIQLTQWFKV